MDPCSLAVRKSIEECNRILAIAQPALLRGAIWQQLLRQCTRRLKIGCRRCLSTPVCPHTRAADVRAANRFQLFNLVRLITTTATTFANSRFRCNRVFALPAVATAMLFVMAVFIFFPFPRVRNAFRERVRSAQTTRPPCRGTGPE